MQMYQIQYIGQLKVTVFFLVGDYVLRPISLEGMICAQYISLQHINPLWTCNLTSKYMPKSIWFKLSAAFYPAKKKGTKGHPLYSLYGIALHRRVLRSSIKA